MPAPRRSLIPLLIVFLVLPLVNGTDSDRLSEVRHRIEPALRLQWSNAGLPWHAPVFLRIFKESSELELWANPGTDAAWIRFKTYPIASFSGKLGPKLQEGDLQAPEGIYATTSTLLNPRSRYHLSFNIGYPNPHDRYHHRTGSLIMIHGSTVSVGCFAMTDPQIEEIYLLVEAALHGTAPSVPIHIFPFRMTQERLQLARDQHHPWLPFWEQLQPIHDAFESTSRPPQVDSSGAVYRLIPSD